MSLCDCVQRMAEDGRRFKPSDIGCRIYWYTPGNFGHNSPPYKSIPFLNVLLTVHLSIILVINQRDAQNLVL